MLQSKDKMEKILLDHNDVFADMVNVLIYGKRVVDEKDLLPSATESMYKQKTGDYANQFRDVAKNYQRKGMMLVRFGAENQTMHDAGMPLRVIGYDGADYRSQYQGSQVVPVVTLVLNFGFKRWEESAKSLYGIMEVPEELKPFVPDYKINVVDVAFLDEKTRNMFTSDFKVLCDFLYQKRVNGGHFKPSEKPIRHIREMLEFLAVFTGDEEYANLTDEMVDLAKRGRKVSMCTVLQSYMEEGLAKGRREGRNNILANMLKQNFTKDQILSVGYTEKEIINAKRKMKQSK